MTVTIIAFPPGAGGNHLKNMLLMDRSFENSYELNLDNYNNGNREVHSAPGRNIQEHKILQAKNATEDYVLHGHFGELAQYRDQIVSIENKKFILITLDTQRDKFLLGTRQKRLGQHSHDYYLHEEQEYLYQSKFYQIYFTTVLSNIYTIPVNEYWHPNLFHYGVLNRVNTFLNKNINVSEAQVLHNRWHINNDINYY
jgi:hypothetical protein